MEFSKEIIEVIDYMGSKIGITIDWTNENIIPYLQQLANKYINWEITTSIVWIIMAILCFALLAFICYKADECEFMIVIGISCAIIIGCQVFDICRCQCFPELQIYNFIQNYM